MEFKINSRDVVASSSSISRLAARVPGELARRLIRKGLEKYVDRIPRTTSVSACSKKHPSRNSSHPQEGSVNQANSLLLEGHGLDSVLQRLNKKAKDFKNSRIIIIIIIIIRRRRRRNEKEEEFPLLFGFP